MTENMLRTSKERVRLLKNGVEGKKIEELYIQHNNFKIIHIPILFDLNQPLKGITKINAETSSIDADAPEPTPKGKRRKWEKTISSFFKSQF